MSEWPDRTPAILSSLQREEAVGDPELRGLDQLG
jgi:hypothetical protein